MKINLKLLLALFFSLIIQNSFAQDKGISGVITDSNNIPIPGVNVSIKGNKIGVQSDFDGKFNIKASAGDRLVFTFIGMKNLEITASPGMKVKMENDSQLIAEVFVNTLGVEVKKNLKNTSNSKVKGDVLRNSGESGLLKSLSAKASNVNIVSNSGDPGSGAYIQIRGQNTITGAGQPLYVIDGTPVSGGEDRDLVGGDVAGVGQQSRANDINPNDVESVTILKGVSAGALWGYRAANGVVLITTKKGKKGKISLEINSTLSYDEVNLPFKTQTTFGEGSNGNFIRNNPNSYGDRIAFRAGGSDVFNTGGAYFVSRSSGKTIYPIATGGKRSTQNFNDSNYKAVIGSGFSVDNHIGLSGGDKNGNFYLGLGNVKQSGVIQGSTYERTTVDFSSTYNINDKTTFKGTFAFSGVNSNRIQQGSNTSGLLLGLYRTPSDFDNSDYIGTYYNVAGLPYENSQRAYRQDTGTFSYENSKDVNPGYNNPLWTTKVQKNPNQVNRYVAGFQLQHEINKSMSILGRFGVDGYSDKRVTVFPISSRENFGDGSASESVTDFQQFNADVMVLGDLNISSNLNLNYTIGANIAETNIATRGGSYINFLIDSDKFSYSNAVNANKTTFLDRTSSRLSGAYISGAFDYKKFLFLTLGGRLETSSTYSPNLKNYFYPSAEIGYQISEHLKNNVLTYSKIKATYGQVAIIPQANAGTTYFVGASGAEGFGSAYDAAGYAGSFQRSGLKGNDQLKPEIRTEIEFGADLEFFSRLKLNATYYSNTTKNNLVNVPINGSSGYSNLYGNFADLKNVGYELDFNLSILKNSDFKLSVYGNWSTNKNEVTRLDNTNSLFLNGFTGSSSRAVLGQPIGVLWGGRWDRDSNGKLILGANNFPTVAPTDGVLGDPNPKWRGAAGLKFGYKGFAVNALFDASIGGQLWDGTNGALNNFGASVVSGNVTTLSVSQATTILNADGNTALSLGYPNPDGTISVRGNVEDFGGGPVLLNQAWYQGNGGGFGPVSEQFIKSASWVKFRELGVSYTLDNKKLLNKTGVESISLTLTTRNLWLWTEDKSLGQDPETNLTGGSNGRGLQYFNHPNTKSYLASINIKF